MNQEKQSLKIAFLAAENPKDKRTLSTSLYYMGQALEKHCGDVYYCDPIFSFEKRYLGRLIYGVSRRLFKKNVLRDRLLFVARKHGKIAAQRLDGRSFDAIIAIGNPQDVGFLATDIPIVLVLDATFALQHDYTPGLSNLWKWAAQQANKVEEIAYQNATVLLYSSYWAARSAIEVYAVDPQKVHTIFWGVNLDTIPSREQVLAKKLSGQCRLLFMSVGWQRKGGDIAYETLLKLHEMGIQAKLTVCGTTPPTGIAHEHMTVIPYLDKNDEQQAGEIEKLYATSDFLILPTRADCVPFVLGEAYAFGVPVIIADTGGIADVVRNGENGYVLPYEARGEAYAQVIAELYRDEQRYTALVQSSRAAFESRLNWDVWAIAVKDVLQKLISPAEVLV